MPTHITNCIVCGKEVGCCNDTHALGCGGKHGEAGCKNPPFIEFCSEECFKELERRMIGAWRNYLRVTKEDGR